MWIKNSAKENEYNKLENSQPQIENPDYRENKIYIDEMKQDIIKEIDIILIWNKI